MKTLVITITVLGLASACGKKSKDSDAATDTTTEYRGLALSALNLTQKTDAATPAGFKATSGLKLANEDAICGTTFPADGSGARAEGYYACIAAYDVRSRFFQGGPTVITDRLESVDGRLNSYVGRLAEYEIPCFDTLNTTDRTTPVVQGANQSDADELVPAYKLSTNSIATTFSDGHVLDFGRTYYYSCSDSFGDSNTTQKVYVGRKDGTWYLGEDQSIPSGSTGTSPFLKTMMSVDADDNMEILFGIASSDLGKSTATNPESGSYSSVTNSVYKQSAGFAQFVVRAKEGIIGASAVMNYACEQRLVMNDKAVYIEVNGNNYGNCFSTDNWVGDSTLSGPAFSSSRTLLKGCLKVSGATPEPQTDLSLCEESGLLVATEAGGGTYEDPFARYGIFKLGTNLASPPTNGFALRAYHGSRLAPDLGAGTNELQLISYPPDAKVVVDDYATASLAFEKTSDSSASDAGTISAACNAATADREKTFTQKAQFKVQSYLDNMPLGEHPNDARTDAEINLETLNTALANTGDAAPVVTTRVTRSLGSSFRGVGTGTLTLKYDGTTVGTASVDQTDLASDKGYTDVSISFTTVPTVTAAGTFTLEYSGKTLLVCNNSISTTRKVNTQLGLASFKVFTKPASE